MDNLKPCPFCGEVKHLELWDGLEDEKDANSNQEDYDYDREYKTIVCNVNVGGCGASSGYAYNDKIAIQKWNTRSKACTT